MSTYLFSLERLHQRRHSTETHGEAHMGAVIAVGNLDALVAQMSLPFGVAASFILMKDVRDQISYVTAREKIKSVGLLVI